MKVVILLLCLTASFQLRSSEEFLPNRANKDEVRLLANILNGYEKRTRPTENFHIPLLVNMSIHLNQIIQVDEKNQIVTLNLWRNILWNDDFLQWNPSDYGNITQVPIYMQNYFFFSFFSLNRVVFFIIVILSSDSNMGTRYSTVQFGDVRYTIQ